MNINIEKLNEYLKTEEILEFDSDEECLEYFNTYDYQNLKSVEEMKTFQGKYGFNVGKKRYHINTENALDVYLNINEVYAKIFCDAIRTMAEKPENIDKKVHFNHNFYDYCSSYGISEYYAMDFIWGVIPEEVILKDYSDNLTYIQTSYRYWSSHVKEFNQAFEYIKHNSEKNMLLKFHFSKHKGIKESLLIINTL